MKSKIIKDRLTEVYRKEGSWPTHLDITQDEYRSLYNSNQKQILSYSNGNLYFVTEGIRIHLSLNHKVSKIWVHKFEGGHLLASPYCLDYDADYNKVISRKQIELTEGIVDVILE